MARGTGAQKRRRAKRAANRTQHLALAPTPTTAEDKAVSAVEAYAATVVTPDVEAALQDLADEAAAFGAIASHSTATVDTTWDGPATVAAAPNNAAVLRYMHAWVDSSGDADAKSSYKFPHHAGRQGAPANMGGVRNGLARLSGSKIPDGDKSGVEAHLQRHMNDFKKTQQDSIVAALVAAGVEDAQSPVTSYELTNGSLAERAFLSAAIAAGVSQTRFADWPCEGELGDHGETLHRGDHDAVYQLDDGTLVWASLGHGWLTVRVASTSSAEAAAAVSTFATAYPPLYREPAPENMTVVPITFWTYNQNYGPSSRLRMIESAAWEDIERNYASGAREELGRLVGGFEPGKDGQLLLWQGEPGTGKTWALRALASEWREWAEFHYITDPDAFFVSAPDYMINVLLADSYEEFVAPAEVGEDAEVVSSVRGGKWRVLILEDTGELLAARAKDAYGQGLSRLLNVVDGMVGQGLRILALVTTNDELGDLHPAAVRPGRCASRIEFGPLSAAEASEWLGEAVESDLTLAELYARSQGAREAFQPVPTGRCANCDHAAAQHEEMANDMRGACEVAGCDCAKFEATDDEATVAHADTDDVTRGYELRLAASTPSTFENVRVSSTAATGDWTVSLTEAQVSEIIGNYVVGNLATRLTDGPSATLPPRTPGPAAPEAPPRTNASEKRWAATLAPEGKPTDDGRMFAPESIAWRDLPLSLMAMVKTADGHDGAEVAGRIDRIWRDGTLIRAEGVFDEGKFGQEIARLVDDRTLRGISVDIAIRDYEVVPRATVLDEAGNYVPPDARAQDEGPEDPIGVMLGDDDLVMVVLSGVIGAVTVCPFPAFEDASITLVASGSVARYQAQGDIVIFDTAEPSESQEIPKVEDADPQTFAVTPKDGPLPVVASAAPVAPPADWFADPQLDELTPLTVGADGRVFGHAAAWDSCHLAFPDACVTAPRSMTGYGLFQLGEIVCSDGGRVPVGKITLGTGHADQRLDWKATAAHYDDTGTVAAFVAAGEDNHGIWVAGALKSDLPDERVRDLCAAVLSGDWRNVGGNLELVALLAVNVPGFPVPRVRALVSSGNGERILSLVAAGVHDGNVTEDDAERLEALRLAADGEFETLAGEAGA